MAGGCAGVSSSKIGIAFVCVIGAALASVLGALLMIIVPVKNNLFLATSLAFAAGVMLYISIVDIYVGKAVGHFEDAGNSSAKAFTYGSICFFCGFPISWVLDKIAERVVYPGHEHNVSQPPTAQRQVTATVKGQSGCLPKKSSSAFSVSVAPSRTTTGIDAEAGIKRAAQSSDIEVAPNRAVVTCDSDEEDHKEKGRKLVHLGLLAAMAMALHNMPEGLVTFVGYMDSIYSGITTAAAIAVHNIPEGMVIGSAVYFGTGLRWKAVAWASVAALAEPLGGLIGLAVVCGGSMTDTVFGILFGLVAGIMVYISLKELLPSARSFDPQDRVTSLFVVAGMIIMCCSLIAISFSQSPEGEQGMDALATGALLPATPAAPSQ